MKFIHIADLHIGKMLNQKSLIEDQEYILNQVIQMMIDNKVSVLVLSGDIYDKQIPSQEAVTLFNDFLSKLINDHKFKVFCISGNHDSSQRLNFGSTILLNSGLYIETFAKMPIAKYILTDEYGDINIYMLPFCTPLYTKINYPKYKEDISDYNDMIKCFLKETTIDKTKRNILLTHHTIVNSSTKRSDSENLVSIGGTECINPSLLSDFDYVALGHLHIGQNIVSNEGTICNIRYSGSILKYSESEANLNKSATLVSLKEKGVVNITKLELKPLHDLKKMTGSYDELLKNINIIDEDYIYFHLTDNKVILNAMQLLKNKYPNALSLTYDNIENASQITKAKKEFKNLTIDEQFIKFYNIINDNNPTEEEIKIIKEVAERSKPNETY